MDLFSASEDQAASEVVDDPGFAAYVAEVQQKQREVIAAERAKMRKAQTLYCNYRAAMARIGLHDLKWLEIGDRLRELEIMEQTIDETHGPDNPVLRYHYLDRKKAGG